MMVKSRQQELKAAGHITPTAKSKEQWMNPHRGSGPFIGSLPGSLTGGVTHPGTRAAACSSVESCGSSQNSWVDCWKLNMSHCNTSSVTRLTHPTLVCFPKRKEAWVCYSQTCPPFVRSSFICTAYQPENSPGVHQKEETNVPATEEYYSAIRGTNCWYNHDTNESKSNYVKWKKLKMQWIWLLKY